MKKSVIIWRLACLIVGAVLIGLGFGGILDSFWSGMGSALLVVGLLNLIRIYRFEKNDEYREKFEVEVNDERNRFIRNKAWAYAGYLFVIIVALLVIVLKIIGQDVLSIAASATVCLMLILYWISYLILKKKY